MSSTSKREGLLCDVSSNTKEYDQTLFEHLRALGALGLYFAMLLNSANGWSTKQVFDFVSLTIESSIIVFPFSSIGSVLSCLWFQMDFFFCLCLSVYFTLSSVWLSLPLYLSRMCNGCCLFSLSHMLLFHVVTVDSDSDDEYSEAGNDQYQHRLSPSSFDE